MSDDVAAITEVTRDLAYRQLDAQFQASGGYDSRAIGVIAFDVAGVAAVLAAKDVFGGLWLVLVAGLLIASVAGLAALWSRQFDVGRTATTVISPAAIPRRAVTTVSDLRLSQVLRCFGRGEPRPR